MKKKFFSEFNLQKSSSGKLYRSNKKFVNLQNDPNNTCIYCVVDLHAITIKQNPEELKRNIRETTAFIASGLDYNKSIIFNQSLVSAHTEAHGCSAVLREWGG